MLEIPHKNDCDTDGEEECEGEAQCSAFHAVHEVHAEEAGYECGEHEDNADAGEHLHDGAHVVVDDVGVCVHRGVEDVGVDVGGLASLTHLNANVLYHVSVKFVDGQFELELGEQVLVASNGSDEVGEAVLKATQRNKIGIAYIAIQILLGFVDAGTNLFEVFQVPDSATEEEAEYHIDRIDEAQPALLLVGDEVNHHVRLEVTDSDEDVALHDDT